MAEDMDLDLDYVPSKMENAEEYRLLFGKYKGEKLEDVPDSYLTWVLSTIDPDQYPGLFPNINTVLDRRWEPVLSEQEEEWQEERRYWGDWRRG